MQPSEKTNTTLISGAILLGIVAAYIGLHAFFVAPKALGALHKHWANSGIELGYPLLIVTVLLMLRSSSWHPFNPGLRFIALLIPTSFLLAICELLDMESPAQLIIYTNFSLLIAALYGYQQALRNILPMCVMLMALPIWYLISPLLQNITVTVVTTAIHVIQIDASVEGNYITVPTGLIHVAEGCSGLKYFLSALTLCFIALNLDRRRFFHQGLLILFAAFLACISNWIRVFILVLVGYKSGLSHPLMEDHDFLGWVVFGAVSLAPFILVLRKVPALKTTSLAEATAPHSKTFFERSGTRQGLITITLAGLIILSPPGLLRLWQSVNPPLMPAQITLPRQLGDWSLTPDFRRDWYPAYPTTEFVLHSSYINDSGTIANISILRYPAQSDSVEFINSLNKVYNPALWRPISHGTIDTGDFLAAETIVKSANGYRYILHWFDTGGHTAHSAIRAKLLALRTPSQPSTLLAFSALCNTDCSKERDALLGFTKYQAYFAETDGREQPPAAP